MHIEMAVWRKLHCVILVLKIVINTVISKNIRCDERVSYPCVS
uniref:Uncharacterized protein n=1 Tax=Manihot esculenta TaxID=3983 RepID=A0A2C9VHB1_MANES